jgi:hypothetical protein
VFYGKLIPLAVTKTRKQGKWWVGFHEIAAQRGENENDKENMMGRQAAVDC